MKKTVLATSVALSLGISATTDAGTAGLTGVWSGTYTFTMLTPDGLSWPASDAIQTWTWDFDAGTIEIANTATFLQDVWVAHSITFTDNGGGAYGTVPDSANLLFDWAVNVNMPVTTEWDVAAVGATAVVSVNYATVLASSPAFIGHHPTFTGTLSKVPIPAAVWLFGSGLIGLIGVARRKGNA